MKRFFLQTGTLTAVLCLSVLFHFGASRADEPLPIELKGIGVTERRGELIPLHVPFFDEAGRTVRLEQFFQRDRPVILVLAYYTCPMLCSIVLNKLTEGLRGVAWTPGREFEVVTVSIDSRDTPAVAAAKKVHYIKEYGRPAASEGWHFLTGEGESSRALADAVGFSYRWDEGTRQFLHSAVVIILTPDGQVSRYLGGLEYSPRDLRLALLEASEGKIGTALDRLLLFCYHYDPVSRKYAVYARNVMRLGGALTAIFLSLVLAGYWRLERGRGSHEPASS